MRIIIAGLASWRLAYMLMFENGPYDLIQKFRHLLKVKHWAELTNEEQIALAEKGDVNGEVFSETRIGEVLTCLGCLSVWTATIISLLTFPFKRKLIVEILSISTITVATELIRKILVGVMNKYDTQF